MLKPNLTVIVLTFNEEKHIQRCIQSLLSITKNILIIDSFSSDKTVAISESLGAKVYQVEWPGNHAKQFQWALTNCPIETEWVMKMDADEFILPNLANEINTRLSTVDEKTSGIYVKRRVKFMNRWIKHGGYYPIWLMRIWRYKHGIMEERWMDEHVKLISGNTLKFEHDIVDDNENDLTWWISKHNNYAVKEAADIFNTIYSFKNYDQIEPKLFGTQEQRKRKLKYFYAHTPLFLRPFIYFIWRYFIKLGFLDGRPGLIWHFLQGFWYRFLVDAKMHEIYLRAGRDRDSIQKVLKEHYEIKF